MNRKYSLHYRLVFQDMDSGKWHYELETSEASNEEYGSEDEAHAGLQRYVEHWL